MKKIAKQRQLVFFKVFTMGPHIFYIYNPVSLLIFKTECQVLFWDQYQLPHCPHLISFMSFLMAILTLRKVRNHRELNFSTLRMLTELEEVIIWKKNKKLYMRQEESS